MTEIRALVIGLMVFVALALFAQVLQLSAQRQSTAAVSERQWVK